MKVWLNTDGGKAHFKSRISFYYFSTLRSLFGKHIKYFILVIKLLVESLKIHWIFSESHHGKGEHDGHGATVKCNIRLFILGGN